MDFSLGILYTPPPAILWHEALLCLPLHRGAPALALPVSYLKEFVGWERLQTS